MATVPGTPMQDTTGGIPTDLQPGPMHFLMAAAIMHQQGRMQLAGDVLPIYPRSGNRELDLQRAEQKYGPGAKGYEGSDPNAVARGVMQGKVKVLKPSGD